MSGLSIRQKTISSLAMFIKTHESGMIMESSRLKMALSMKETGIMIEQTDMVNLFIKTENITLEILEMIELTVKELSITKTVHL